MLGMNTLSKEKLNSQKAKKNLTNQKISQLTNIPISNIDKIFSGINKNPTLDTLQKIALVLDCSIDDFINYEKSPVYPVYINKEIKELLDCAQKLKPDEIELLIKIAKKMER